MYESFYGFKEKPFNLTPDPDYLFMSRGHGETYTHLEYAIIENKGFVVITGEIGSGKTMLLNFFLRKLKKNIQVGVINHTLIQPRQLIKMICQEFELPTNGRDQAAMLEVFYNFLLEQFAEKKRVVLIIDEAQNLPDKTLEGIRLLSNLESEKNHLLQILLVGQPELKQKLQKKDLKQFIQRVTVYYHLNGLNEDEVDQYIRHRLNIAGSKNMDIFDKEAVEAVSKYSRGIPRLINVLCDTALVHGFADELKTIDKNIIEEVFRIRNLGGIFTESKKVKKNRSPFLLKKQIFEQFDGRIAMIEEKINAIENALTFVNQELDTLSSSKDKRDELVLDLTKMLKQSMTSQVNLMFEISELKRKEKSDDLA
jgi:general secretion pathway protein A